MIVSTEGVTRLVVKQTDEDRQKREREGCHLSIIVTDDRRQRDVPVTQLVALGLQDSGGQAICPKGINVSHYLEIEPRVFQQHIK